MSDDKIIIEQEEDDLEISESSKKPTIRVLRFVLGGEDYCIPVTQVKEVIRVPDVTRIPMSPAFVKGIFNLRGEILTVLDIREFFGLSEPEKITDSRIIVTDAPGYNVGILADSLEGTEDVTEDSIQEPLATLKQELRNYTKGQIQWQERIITLLDIEKVLRCDDIKRLQKGE